jgi:hypothetical protein
LRRPRSSSHRLCRGCLTDFRGVKHSVEVTAESLFEAAILGLAALRQDGWTDGIRRTTMLEVQIQGPVVTHKLSLEQIHHWLNSTALSPTERVRKDKLKALLE